ncbi:MAG: thioredoxin family protein, partial [Rhodothermia bacterium]|nr:thioredoxin family protein [Rhodothermia bacterium]
CNHCQFVVHVRAELVRMANEYREAGVQFIGINSNDAVRYPDDSFSRMQEDAETYGFSFPYLYDESQDVARAYGAVCTPDVFVYDSNRELRYHGRIDETRPGGQPANGRELRSALDQLIATGVVEGEQVPSIGCNIKWKPDGS